MKLPDHSRLELDHAFDISKHSDNDDKDSAQAFIMRALQDAASSEVPVRFEVWKMCIPPPSNGFELPFLPAEAALEQ